MQVRRVAVQLALVLAVAVSLAAGVAADVLDDINARGVVRVGVMTDYPPFGTVDGSLRPQGYDVDLSALLERAWKVRVEFVPVTAPNRVPTLQTGKADIMLNIGRSDERAKVVDFTQPYAPYYIGIRARRGLPVPPDALDVLVRDMRGGRCHRGTFVRDLGQEWAVDRNYHKRLACGGQAHAALEAVMDLRARVGPAAVETVTSLEVAVHAFALTMDERQPATSLAARFSIPHLVAVAWLHGRTDAAAFGDELLHEPKVAALRARVRMVPFAPSLPPPHHRAARVRAMLPDAACAAAECLAARGSRSHPWSSDAIADKCRALAGDRHAAFLASLLEFGARDAAMPVARALRA